MKLTEKICTCDVCQKRVTDKGGQQIGSNPFAGWFFVKRNIDPSRPAILELGPQEWDICSTTCLAELSTLLSRNEPFPDHSPLAGLKKVLKDVLKKKRA